MPEWAWIMLSVAGLPVLVGISASIVFYRLAHAEVGDFTEQEIQMMWGEDAEGIE